METVVAQQLIAPRNPLSSSKGNGSYGDAIMVQPLEVGVSRMIDTESAEVVEAELLAEAVTARAAVEEAVR